MAFQKGFFGVGIAGQDTGSKQLVSALGSLNKNLQKYGEYVGTELDKEVKAEAEKVARIDNFKSYQDAVDSGEIDATKSDFYIAAYDNIKGKTAGIEYNTKKRIAFETWFADMTNSDDDDVDGQQYMQWSEQYDRDYMNQMGEYSTHFHKGFDPFVAMSSQQLSSKYASANATRLKEKGKLNLQLIVEDTIAKNPNDLSTVQSYLNELDLQSNEFRFVGRNDFNKTVVQAAENVVSTLAIKGNVDSDYELAEEIMLMIKDFKRPNGSRLLAGKDIEAWNKKIEKLQDEKRLHEKDLTRLTQDAAVSDYIKEKLKDTDAKFADPLENDPESLEGKEKFNKLMIEYNSKWAAFLRENKNLPPDQVIMAADILIDDLTAKYKEADINKIYNYTKGSKFNILGRFKLIGNSYVELSQNETVPGDTVIDSNALADPVIASLMRQTGRGKTSADGKKFTFTVDELGELYDEYEAWKETLNE